MIDMRYKPYFLPQVSAPFDVVLHGLDDEGVSYEIVEVDPNELEASQGITFSDEVGKVNLDDNNPIWLANENKVLDGHHRMVRAMLDGKMNKAVKIDMNEKDASRLLNKIQDIWEYEHRFQMEVVGQDAINTDNQINSGVSDNEFLSSLEEDNMKVRSADSGNTHINQVTVLAYRRDPINEKSVVGNFFSLKPIEGFDTFEIDFDNLLDTHQLGVTYKESQEPVDILAKVWFPHVNFEKISNQYGMPSENLKNRAIAEKAMSLGYDGIKYGDTLIQGLK